MERKLTSKGTTTDDHLTLIMTSTHVVKMSVNVIVNSPSQYYTHPDDQWYFDRDKNHNNRKKRFPWT